MSQFRTTFAIIQYIGINRERFDGLLTISWSIDNALTIIRKNYDRFIYTCCISYAHDAILHNNSLFVIIVTFKMHNIEYTLHLSGRITV